MNDEISQIRELLEKVEKTLSNNDNDEIKKHFDFLEVPEIISNIVDYLQPLLYLPLWY